ncbi:MAG: TIGR04076 family protein [Clostridia bacterium]|nr:TIGR04076 family protein [Clostridia bacterium]
MKKVRITVMKMARYTDLIDEYENPLENECEMTLGRVFVANGWQMPEGMCKNAWETLSPYVMALSHGASDFFEGWMKNKKSAMLSCNDGFRPVSFLLETLEEDADS